MSFSNFIFLSILLINLSFSQIPGISPNKNPSGMEIHVFKENIDIPESILACSDSKYAPNSSGVWSYSQIALAFYEYGIKYWNFPEKNKFQSHIGDCVAALIIASGECAHIPGSQGCSTNSGSSGVWQTDFLRTIPGFIEQPIMNLCTSAFGVGYMIAPWLADNEKTCTISVNNGTPASMFTCYNARLTVNEYNCDDPKAVKGKIYENFIGPFCHKSWASRWDHCNGCCTLFNGGGNNYQPPFPEYYLNIAVEEGGMQFEAICRNIAENIEL